MCYRTVNKKYPVIFGYFFSCRNRTCRLCILDVWWSCVAAVRARCELVRDVCCATYFAHNFKRIQAAATALSAASIPRPRSIGVVPLVVSPYSFPSDRGNLKRWVCDHLTSCGSLWRLWRRRSLVIDALDWLMLLFGRKNTTPVSSRRVSYVLFSLPAFVWEFH